MGRTYEFIRQAKVFYVSTVNGNMPAARPFGAMMEYNGVLHITTANTKAVYAQFIANSFIQIVALDEGTRDWIRIDGKVTEVFDLEAKQAMLDAWPILRSRFGSNDCEEYALFRIVDMKSWLYTDDGEIKLDG